MVKETKYEERTVFAVTVKTKHFMRDWCQSVRNMVGMNLPAYEEMIEDALEESYIKLMKKYPQVYDVKFTTAQVQNGACEVICYGKIKVKGGTIGKRK